MLSCLLHFDISVANLQLSAELFFSQHFERVVFAHYTDGDVVFSQLSVLGRGAQCSDTMLNELLNTGVRESLKVLFEVGLC